MSKGRTYTELRSYQRGYAASRKRIAELQRQLAEANAQVEALRAFFRWGTVPGQVDDMLEQAVFHKAMTEPQAALVREMME